MAKPTLRNTLIVDCDVTDRSDIPSFLMERGDAAAVVTQQCMKLRHVTMYLKLCATIVLMQISIGTAFAVDDKKTAAGRASTGDPRRASSLRAGFNEILP